MNEKNFLGRGEITKVDTDRGLVFGWAMVSKIDGEEYFDKQGDHIPMDVLIDATVDFMTDSRANDTMHNEQASGEIIFAMPWDAEIAKGFGMSDPPVEGLMIAARPSPEDLEKFDSGEFTGFSIGGFLMEEAE